MSEPLSGSGTAAALGGATVYGLFTGTDFGIVFGAFTGSDHALIRWPHYPLILLQSCVIPV